MHIAPLRLAAFLRYTFQFVRLHFCRNPAWFFPSPLESRNVFPSSWNTQTRLPFPRKWRTSLRVSWRWKNENPTDSTKPVGFPSSPSPRSCLIYSRQDAITVFDKLRCFWEMTYKIQAHSWPILLMLQMITSITAAEYNSASNLTDRSSITA